MDRADIMQTGDTGSMPSLRQAFALLIAGAAPALLAACADQPKPAAPDSASQAAPVVDDRRLLRFFGLMDEDGDGAVSRPEFQAGKGSVFMAMDLDGSMALTPDETRLKPDAFALLSGGDGMIDGEEFIAADVAQFDKIDANRDNEISYDELRAYMAKFE